MSYGPKNSAELTQLFLEKLILAARGEDTIILESQNLPLRVRKTLTPSQAKVLVEMFGKVRPEAVDPKAKVRKRMGAKEFAELGLLHEVNRRILHPLGLALEIVQEDDGRTSFGEVWDFRGDREGMYFAEVDPTKAARVKAMEDERREDRTKALGYWIQESK